MPNHSLSVLTDESTANRSAVLHRWLLESPTTNCPLALVCMDSESRIESCNLTFAAMFLYSPDEVVGRLLQDVLGKGLHELLGIPRKLRIHRIVEPLVLPGNRPATSDVRRKDGSIIHVELQVIPAQSSGVIAIFQDVTERMKAELALRLSEAKFSRAFQVVPTTMTISTAKENRYIDVNDTWMRLSGYSREEAIGRTPLELGFFDDPEVFHRLNERIASQGGLVRNVQQRLRMRDGSIVIGSLSAEDFHVNGEVLRIVVIADITKLRRSEEALSKVTRGFIVSKEREQRRIAGDLHDDIGQRLALLQMGLEQLWRDMSAEPAEFRDRIQKLATQAADTAEGLRRLTHDLHSQKLGLLDVEHALRGLCADVGTHLDLEIEFTSHDNSTTVTDDISVCLFRVLQEALNNAARHSGSRRIDVELWTESGAIHLRAQDFGAGFDARSEERSGIGLITMRERVAMMGGTLRIASTPESGTEITVRIPLKRLPGSAARYGI